MIDLFLFWRVLFSIKIKDFGFSKMLISVCTFVVYIEKSTEYVDIPRIVMGYIDPSLMTWLP